MPNRSERNATPADLLALTLRIQQAERASRGDRFIQAQRLREQLAEERDPPQTQVGRLLWLIEQGGDQAIERDTAKARSAFALTGLLITLFGLLSGVLLASAVFYYNGQAPVNIVAAIGVFVVLQGLLLLLAILAALPRGWARWLPGMEGLQETLRLASPGRLALLGARLLPQDMREALSAALGRTGAHQRIYGRVQLWAILRWSQLYALALNLAAAVAFLYLVFFTDLAFGWSTTLKIVPADFHQILHTIALPWSWQDTLTPSMELVENSRYYRGTAFNPEHRGAWWPFVLTAMLVYGLLPRLVAFIVASNRLGSASQLALLATPGAIDLLNQLSASDTTRMATGNGTAPANDPNEQISLGTCPMVVDWSRAAGSAQRAAELLAIDPGGYAVAGGSQDVSDDQRAIESLGREVSDEGVVLMVKLWEPPVIETTEFLVALRRAIGDRLPVRVVPVACDIDGRVISDDPVLVEQWRLRVRAIGDPWTRVGQPVGLSVPPTEQPDV